MRKVVRLLLLAYWMVTWKNIEAVSIGSTYVDGFLRNYDCSLQEIEHSQKFPTKDEALKFIEKTKSRYTSDFKLWRVEERTR